MKFFYLILTLLVISTPNLSARDNPFEPTKTYDEELARMMEIEEDFPAEFQEKDPSQYEQMSPVVVETPKVEPKKVVVKPKEKAKPKVPDANLVYVPLRDQMHTKQAVIAILPGVEVSFEGKKLEIKSKYEVFQKFDLNEENKMILDFRATTSFYTIRKDLNSQYFTKLVVGNHKEEKFFRVAIQLPASPKDYKVTYNDDVVTIVFEESGLK
ncbi:MAG: AMIN domain-containing protein [Arcobacteraceae bacterium]